MARQCVSPRPVGRTMIQLQCSHCGKSFQIAKASYNYRLQQGAANFYCSRTCTGKGRRIEKSLEQKKADKAAYDREFRVKNAQRLKVEKAAYFQRTYDPVKAAIHRKTRMPYHIQYCRQPQYRAYKRDYDQQYLAKKKYGEFWESALLTNQIQALYDDKEVRQQNNLHNKSIKRKRAWQQHNKNSLPRP